MQSMMLHRNTVLFGVVDCVKQDLRGGEVRIGFSGRVSNLSDGK